MRPPPLFSFFLLLHSLLLLAVCASALPAGRRAVAGDVARRQEGVLTQPVTVQTTHTSNSSLGPMIEACIVRMTPITLDNGDPAVEVVKNCTLSLENPAGDGNSTIPQPLPATSSGIDSISTSTASALLDPSSTPSSASVSPPPSSSSSSSLPTISDTSITNAPLTTDPPVPITASAQDPAPAAPTSVEPLNPEVDVGQQNPVSSSSGSLASATAAGALQSPAGGVTIPGKKLSVLPIGLGVFAGLSVIALIIVGLVTYERTKYRKLFRQRKRAEALDFSSGR